MKRYHMSFAASLIHVPECPERTAQRELQSFDIEFQVWPSRAAMLQTITMQRRAAPRPNHWRPCK